jgi:hypothetical protein
VDSKRGDEIVKGLEREDCEEMSSSAGGLKQKPGLGGVRKFGDWFRVWSSMMWILYFH